MEITYEEWWYGHWEEYLIACKQYDITPIYAWGGMGYS